MQGTHLACTFGESTCDAVPPLSRAAQHQAILDFIEPYLAYYLKGNAASWTAFNDSLSITDTSRFTYQESCTITNIKENTSEELSIFPNPSSSSITLYYGSTGKYAINVVDVLGKQVLPKVIGYNMPGASKSIDISSLTKGMYFVELNINGQRLYKKILKD